MQIAPATHFTSVPRGLAWIEIDAALGATLWLQGMQKGALRDHDGHEVVCVHLIAKAGARPAPRYVKRWKGANGKWRYAYASHEGGGIHNAAHFGEGARFAHGNGHYEIGADGTATHSHTGHQISVGELGAHLEAHHGADIAAHKKGVLDRFIEQINEASTPKHKAALEKKAAAYGYTKPDPEGAKAKRTPYRAPDGFHEKAAIAAHRKLKDGDEKKAQSNAANLAHHVQRMLVEEHHAGAKTSDEAMDRVKSRMGKHGGGSDAVNEPMLNPPGIKVGAARDARLPVLTNEQDVTEASIAGRRHIDASPSAFAAKDSVSKKSASGPAKVAQKDGSTKVDRLTDDEYADTHDEMARLTQELNPGGLQQGPKGSARDALVAKINAARAKLGLKPHSDDPYADRSGERGARQHAMGIRERQRAAKAEAKTPEPTAKKDDAQPSEADMFSGGAWGKTDAPKAEPIAQKKDDAQGPDRMEHSPKSSHIKHVEWIADNPKSNKGTLRVHFKTGHVHDHYDRHRDDFTGMRDAASAGEFYNDRVRGIGESKAVREASPQQKKEARIEANDKQRAASETKRQSAVANYMAKNDPDSVVKTERGPFPKGEEPKPPAAKPAPEIAAKPEKKAVTMTGTNLHALHAHFGDKDEAPNRAEGGRAAHIKRAVDAGLVEAAPDRKTLRLTESGKAVMKTQRERAAEADADKTRIEKQRDAEKSTPKSFGPISAANDTPSPSAAKPRAAAPSDALSHPGMRKEADDGSLQAMSASIRNRERQHIQSMLNDDVHPVVRSNLASKLRESNIGKHDSPELAEARKAALAQFNANKPSTSQPRITREDAEHDTYRSRLAGLEKINGDSQNARLSAMESEEQKSPNWRQRRVDRSTALASEHRDNAKALRDEAEHGVFQYVGRNDDLRTKAYQAERAAQHHEHDAHLHAMPDAEFSRHHEGMKSAREALDAKGPGKLKGPDREKMEAKHADHAKALGIKPDRISGEAGNARVERHAKRVARWASMAANAEPEASGDAPDNTPTSQTATSASAEPVAERTGDEHYAAAQSTYGLSDRDMQIVKRRSQDAVKGHTQADAHDQAKAAVRDAVHRHIFQDRNMSPSQASKWMKEREAKAVTPVPAKAGSAPEAPAKAPEPKPEPESGAKPDAPAKPVAVSQDERDAQNAKHKANVQATKKYLDGAIKRAKTKPSGAKDRDVARARASYEQASKDWNNWQAGIPEPSGDDDDGGSNDLKDHHNTVKSYRKDEPGVKEPKVGRTVVHANDDEHLVHEDDMSSSNITTGRLARSEIVGVDKDRRKVKLRSEDGTEHEVDDHHLSRGVIEKSPADIEAEEKQGKLFKGLSAILKALATPWVEIPEDLALALVAKGKSHKYIKKVATGKTSKTGKPVYRYYYKVAADTHAAKHFHTGSAFADGKHGGHWHIHAKDGDKLHLKHDETGEERHMTTSELSTMLHSTHNVGAVEEAQRAKAKAEVAAAKESGSAKHVEAAKKRAEAVGVKEDPKMAPQDPTPAGARHVVQLPELKGSEKQVEWAERLRTAALEWESETRAKDMEETLDPENLHGDEPVHVEDAEHRARLRLMLEPILRMQSSAKWWIDTFKDRPRQMAEDIKRRQFKEQAWIRGDLARRMISEVLYAAEKDQALHRQANAGTPRHRDFMDRVKAEFDDESKIFGSARTVNKGRSLDAFIAALARTD